jgi:hypothetical protein
MRYFKHKNKFLPINGKDISHIGLDSGHNLTYFFTDGTKLVGQTASLWNSGAIDGFLKSGYWIEIYPETYYVKSEGSWVDTAYIIERNDGKYTLIYFDGTQTYSHSSFENTYGDWRRTGFIKQVSKEEAEKRLIKKPLGTKPTVLSPIDPSSIEVGMNLTALSRKNMEDRSYRGEALEVKSVCLPFIVIQTKYGPTSLDTRDWNLAQLPQDYVDALKKG